MPAVPMRGRDAGSDRSGDGTSRGPAPGPPVNFAPFRIESAALSHVGRVRDTNQDSFCIREGDGLWAVADGMGGHEGGEWASGKVAEKLAAIEVPDDLDEASARVEQAVRDANAAILAEAGGRGRQMGTTLVALIVKGDRY